MYYNTNTPGFRNNPAEFTPSAGLSLCLMLLRNLAVAAMAELMQDLNRGRGRQTTRGTVCHPDHHHAWMEAPEASHEQRIWLFLFFSAAAFWRLRHLRGVAKGGPGS